MSLTAAKENVQHIGDLTIDAENFRARKNGQQINLTPRGFDVLLLLISNAGRVVEKQEIFDAVWKETFVSDNALTKIIKEIRQALDDDASKPRYIETVPKRGYRFIAANEENSDLSASSIPGKKGAEHFPVSAETLPEENFPGSKPQNIFVRAGKIFSAAALISVLFFAALLIYRQIQATNAPVRTIAVLPFKPLNADSRDESLEMGMAETLITRLSNLRQVVVRPINAVRKFTDLQQDPIKAGQEIQAEAVLDGSIQKAGERVRITVRLIKVSDGQPLWAEQFDENFTDIFKVQDSIAQRVTNALTLQLTGQEKEQIIKHYTDNPEAYQFYMRGQLVWHGRRQNWIEQSLEFYRQALEKDPNFALAHIGMADCFIMLSGHRKLSMKEAEARARPSILRALEIDSSLAQAHNALAELLYQYEYDWSGAEKEFQKAIELNPNIAWIRQAYGWFLMTQGRFADSALEMEQARRLDPSSLTINVGLGRLYYFNRQYDQAIRHFQNIIAIEPNDSSAHYALYTTYEQKRMYPEALDSFLNSRGNYKSNPQIADNIRKTFREEGWRGLLLKQLEVMKKNAHKDLIEPYAFANLYVRLGQKEEAFSWLEKSFEKGDPALIQLKIDPIYDELRDDPRYNELIRKIGLQP